MAVGDEDESGEKKLKNRDSDQPDDEGDALIDEEDEEQEEDKSTIA